jgi:hypothetical protein
MDFSVKLPAGGKLSLVDTSEAVARAVSAAIASMASAPAGTPSPPALLSALLTAHGVSLAWNAVPAATDYVVLRGPPGIPLDPYHHRIVSTPATHLVDSGGPGGAVAYAVASEAGGQIGAPTVPVTPVAPVAPPSRSQALPPPPAKVRFKPNFAPPAVGANLMIDLDTDPLSFDDIQYVRPLIAAELDWHGPRGVWESMSAGTVNAPTHLGITMGAGALTGSQLEADGAQALAGLAANAHDFGLDLVVTVVP